MRLRLGPQQILAGRNLKKIDQFVPKIRRLLADCLFRLGGLNARSSAAYLEVSTALLPSFRCFLSTRNKISERKFTFGCDWAAEKRGSL